MTSKEGSIRKKGNSYELRVWIGGEQKSFYGKSEAATRKKLREYRKNTPVDTKLYSEALLGEYVYDYLLNYKYGKIKDSSYDILERVYNNQIKCYEISTKKLKDITPKDMQTYLDLLNTKYSTSIIKKVLEILSPALKLAVINDMVKFNVLDFVAMPRKQPVIGMIEEKEEPVYTEDEANKLTDICMKFYGESLRNTRRYRYAPSYVLLLNTGMRVGEMCALTWKDVDLDKRTITINKTQTLINNRERFESDNKKVSIITSTKTARSNRVIPVNDTSYYILVELKKRQKECGIKSDYVIASPEGNMMITRVVEQTFKRICEENGIQCKGVHALRHTFGSLLLMKGVDVKVVSEILGHSTVKFTYDRYIHLLNNIKAQSINLIGATDIAERSAGLYEQL